MRGAGLQVRVDEILSLARTAGVSAAPLLRTAAAEEGRRQAARSAAAAQRLAVLLVLPTGLCLLPAMVLLAVAPVVLDLVLGVLSTT